MTYFDLHEIYTEHQHPAGFGPARLEPENMLTDRMVIVQYPAGAGGKFLINCLGISNGAVLQEKNLAKQQVQGNLSTVDKGDFLLGALANTNETWTDLNMGCHTLFDVHMSISDTEWVYPELAYHRRWHPVIKECISKKLCLFQVSHTARATRWNKQIWPNAKVIVFVNTDPFFDKYRSNFPGLPDLAKTQQSFNLWNSMRESHWPELPPRWLENFEKSPFIEILDEIKSHPKYEDLLYYIPSEHYFDCRKKLEHDATAAMVLEENFAEHFIWDTEWYLYPDLFCEKVAEVYEFLDLDDFDKSLIEKLHKAYLQSISNVQNYIYQK